MKFSFEQRKVPWLKILTSRAVWVSTIGHFGGAWASITMVTQTPIYFRMIHGWNMQMIGLISGIPHLARMVFAFIFSLFVESLLKKKRINLTNARKLAGGFALLLNGVFTVCLAYSGCNSIAASIFLTLSTAVYGAISSGPLANGIDISPNYSGIILGVSLMFANTTGVMSSYIVGKLTLGNVSFEKQKTKFLFGQ